MTKHPGAPSAAKLARKTTHHNTVPPFPHHYPKGEETVFAVRSPEPHRMSALYTPTCATRRFTASTREAPCLSAVQENPGADLGSGLRAPMAAFSTARPGTRSASLTCPRATNLHLYLRVLLWAPLLKFVGHSNRPKPRLSLPCENEDTCASGSTVAMAP